VGKNAKNEFLGQFLQVGKNVELSRFHPNFEKNRVEPDQMEFLECIQIFGVY